MKLTIELKDGKVSTTSSEPVTIETVINLTMSAALLQMNHVLHNTPHELQREMKGLLFDQLNEAASTALAKFAPEIELRPDITEEAIHRQEKAIMKEVISQYD